MKTPKIFQKLFIALLLVVCSFNAQIFANENEADLPAKTTNSKSRKDLKLHKFDLSFELLMVFCQLLFFANMGSILDIRIFFLGAYLLTAPNIGFGLNLGYSFEL